MRHHQEGKLLVNKYPELKSVIITSLCKSDRFRALCADYNVCADAVAYWSSVTSDNSLLRRREFAGLLGDLEKEILVYIEEITGLEQAKGTRGNND